MDLRKTKMKIPFLLQLAKSSPLLLDIMISALSDLSKFHRGFQCPKNATCFNL